MKSTLPPCCGAATCVRGGASAAPVESCTNTRRMTSTASRIGNAWRTSSPEKKRKHFESFTQSSNNPPVPRMM